MPHSDHQIEACWHDKLLIPPGYRVAPATRFYNHNGSRIKEDAGSPHGCPNRTLFLLRDENRSEGNNFCLGHE